MKITFERVQRITIETADDSLEGHTAFYWSDWANNAGTALGKGSILNGVFNGDMPHDRVIERDVGQWQAVSADPAFVEPKSRQPRPRRHFV